MNNIVQIDPKQFGLEETKAADIAAQFKPMLDRMVELEAEYNQVINLPIELAETARKAKALRLQYVKVRTGTAEIHKKQKDFYLSGGRFVDGWKNAQLFASQGIESKLEEIEKYSENQEKKRIAELQEARITELAPYGVENLQSLNLGVMAQSVWDNFLSGTIANYNAKKQAEKEAQEAEAKRVSEEAAERERVRLENAKLKAEMEAKERELESQRQQAAKEKAIADAKLKAEMEAKERAERELQQAAQKAEAERKAKAEAERKAKAAPDKEKLIAFAQSLNSIQFPNVQSEDAGKVLNDAKQLLAKIAAFVTEKSNQL